MGETREPEAARDPGGSVSVSKKKLKTEKEMSDSHTPAKRKNVNNYMQSTPLAAPQKISVARPPIPKYTPESTNDMTASSLLDQLHGRVYAVGGTTLPGKRLEKFLRNAFQSEPEPLVEKYLQGKSLNLGSRGCKLKSGVASARKLQQELVARQCYGRRLSNTRLKKMRIFNLFGQKFPLSTLRKVHTTFQRRTATASPKYLLKGDLHGCLLRITRSLTPELVGTSGVIVTESRNTFGVAILERPGRFRLDGLRSKAMNMEVEGDISPSPKSPPSKDIMMRVQCVPKANSTFAMACGGRLMVVEGQDLRHREV